MVLDEPFHIDKEKFVPSFNSGGYGLKGSQTNRSEEIVDALIEFESEVVPNMFDIEWMNIAAKARRQPFYNKRDQTMVSHILPGIEVLSGIVDRNPSVSSDRIRECIALWTVHDIHKIIDNNREQEFEISTDYVREWTEKLGLEEFAPNLNIKDYHSCAVALHNSEKSMVDDSTNRFTRLRPLIRLTDAVMSIYEYNEYREQTEKEVNTVFARPNEKYIPMTHSLDFKDSVMRRLVNKSVYDIIGETGAEPIDIREDGVMYVSSETNLKPENIENIGTKITQKFLENLRGGYQVFRNNAYLGGDIDSPQSRSEYSIMPRVFEISKLSKLCLNEFELIQRIVQAAVEQQGRPWDISDESKRQISILEDNLDINIPKSPMVEGMAALVHTIYREVLPELVDSENSVVQHRTLESATLEVFNCPKEVQKEVIEAMKNKNIDSSAVSWPYKYIIAKSLNEHIGEKLTKKERQRKLIEVLTENLSKFDGWEEFGNSEDDIENEIYLRIAANTSINGKLINEIEGSKFVEKLDSHQKNGMCYICDMATSQKSSSPDLLSHRDFDVLNRTFVKNQKSELEKADFTGAVPANPICVCCQIELTMRAQQEGRHSIDDKLHVSVHATNSYSVASLTRFSNILDYLKKETFENERRVPYTSMGRIYGELMEGYLSQKSGISSIVDRERLFDVGIRNDEINSAISLPDDSESTLVATVVCVIVASLMSGVRVCISRKPQIRTNIPDNDNLIVFGPGLNMFEDILDNREDVTSLPNRIKILDRLLVLGNRTSSPALMIQRYSNMGNRNILPGSRIYSIVSNQTNDTQSALDAASIDALASEGDVFAREILISSSELGDAIEGICPEENIDMLEGILYDVFEVIESLDNKTEKKIIESTKDELARKKRLDVGLEDLREDGYADVFARKLAEVVTGHSGGKNQLSHLRRPLIDGIIVRCIIYAGDDNE